MARHGAEGSLGQAGFDLSSQLLDGCDLAAQAQDLGNLARFDDGCVHAAYSQLIEQILSVDANPVWRRRRRPGMASSVQPTPSDGSKHLDSRATELLQPPPQPA